MVLKKAHLKKTIAGALAGAVAFAGAYFIPAKSARAGDKVFAGITFPLSKDFLKGARVEVGYAHFNNDNFGVNGEVFVEPFNKALGIGVNGYTGTEDGGVSGGFEFGYNIENHKAIEAINARVEALKGITSLGARLPLNGFKPEFSGLEFRLGLGTPKWDKDEKTTNTPATTTSNNSSSTTSSSGSSTTPGSLF